MTVSLRDSQGRNWTVEGDWHAEVVGADFDGRGKILAWFRPLSPGAHLEPVNEIDVLEEVAASLVVATKPTLPAGD